MRLAVRLMNMRRTDRRSSLIYRAAIFSISPINAFLLAYFAILGPLQSPPCRAFSSVKHGLVLCSSYANAFLRFVWCSGKANFPTPCSPGMCVLRKQALFSPFFPLTIFPQNDRLRFRRRGVCGCPSFSKADVSGTAAGSLPACLVCPNA